MRIRYVLKVNRKRNGVALDSFINDTKSFSHTLEVLFSLVSWHINHCRLFNAKSIFIRINGSISNNSVHSFKVKIPFHFKQFSLP